MPKDPEDGTEMEKAPLLPPSAALPAATGAATLPAATGAATGAATLPGATGAATGAAALPRAARVGNSGDASSAAASSPRSFFNMLRNSFQEWFMRPQLGRRDRLRPLNAKTLADAVASFAKESAGSGVAHEASEFANAVEVFANAKDSRRRAAAGQLHAAGVRLSSAVATDPDLTEVTNDLIIAMEAVVAAAQEIGEVSNNSGPEMRLKKFVETALSFKIAASSSAAMAKPAKKFYHASVDFAAGKDRGKKVVDSGLSKSAKILLHAAEASNHLDPKLASQGFLLVQDAEDILLDDKLDYHFSSQGNFLKHCLRSYCRKLSWNQCSCFCCCSRGPCLPLNQQQIARQAKHAETQKWLYGLLLATPIALLAGLRAADLLTKTSAVWLGGLTALGWIVVSVGAMASLFGMSSIELFCAHHISRIGFIALVVLFVQYMFMMFFPAAEMIFWGLLAIGVGFHALLWIMSCRGASQDDDVSCNCKCVKCTLCSKCNTKV